jgi:hypothetical protein
MKPYKIGPFLIPKGVELGKSLKVIAVALGIALGIAWAAISV